MTVARTAPAARGTRGFTLIELLVAVGLATILITTVVLIFYGSTDIFKTSEARMTVFGNARAALDIFARDLQSCLPLESGQQSFLITNAGGPGFTAAGLPAAGDMALDTIRFRAIVPVNSTAPATPLPATTLRTVEVFYQLVADNDPELLTSTGAATTQRTARNIYNMQKQVFDFAAAGSPEMTLERAALCHYVLSLNLEYFGNVGGQVRPFPPTAGPCWGGPGGTPAPVGAGTPLSNPNLHPRLPLGVRLTLRVVEGAGERQERMITRTVWIPLS